MSNNPLSTTSVDEYVPQLRERKINISLVSIPDPNLEAAIRHRIGKPQGPILISELEELTSLSASDKNITDLTGLEYCINLTDLYLSHNQIIDVSPLSSLTNLVALTLSDNQIDDISPLVANSGLSQEDTVTLTSNPLSATSLNDYIPQLEKRGVDVSW